MDWTPIKGWEGVYEVHPDGKVRRVAYKGGARASKPELKLIQLGKYKGVTLCQLPRRENHYIHHLVLETFVGPRPAGMEGEHLDDNRGHNYLSNLQWSTHKDNCARRGKCTSTI